MDRHIRIRLNDPHSFLHFHKVSPNIRPLPLRTTHPENQEHKNTAKQMKKIIFDPDSKIQEENSFIDWFTGFVRFFASQSTLFVTEYQREYIVLNIFTLITA